MNHIERYPLTWPLGYKRTQHPVRSAFKVSGFGRARDFVISEIKKMNGHSVIISTNIPLRLDGLPYATFATPEDKGVAVYFVKGKENYVFCCDKWNNINDNMHAIGKTIEALRAIDRWGVSEMMDRAFLGFQQLPPGNRSVSKKWYEILEVEESCDWEAVRSAYRSKVKTFHPDNIVNGNIFEFNKVQRAYEDAKIIHGIL